MTADQSPDLVTALRELVASYTEADVIAPAHRFLADDLLGDLRAILDAHPTPAQSSAQEVVALREEYAEAIDAMQHATRLHADARIEVERLREVVRLTQRDRDARRKQREYARQQRDDALARLAALPTALTSDAAVEAAAMLTVCLICYAAASEQCKTIKHAPVIKADGFHASRTSYAKAALRAAVVTLPTEGGE